MLFAHWVDSAQRTDWVALYKGDFDVFDERIKFLIKTERINTFVEIFDLCPGYMYMVVAVSGHCGLLDRVLEKDNPLNPDSNLYGSGILDACARLAAENGHLGTIMRLKEITKPSRRVLLDMFHGASVGLKGAPEHERDRYVGVLGALRGWHPDIEKWQ